MLPVVVVHVPEVTDTSDVPCGPDPLRKLRVAVCVPAAGVFMTKVTTSIQWPAVRALLKATAVPAMVKTVVALVEAALATTNSPVSVIVKTPELL